MKFNKFWNTCLLLLLVSSQGFAQVEYGVIVDEDGWTNIRREAHINSEIIGQIEEGEIFWLNLDNDSSQWYQVCFLDENKTNYSPITYPVGLGERIVKWGFIHKSRVQEIKEEPIQLEREFTGSRSKYYNDSIEISISFIDFESSMIEYWDSNKSIVSKIDGEYVWGTDGMLPTEQFAEIKINISGIEILLGKDDLRGFYQPNNHSLTFSYESLTDCYLLRIHNSDGAGYYESLWQIKGNNCINRYAFAPY